ncbi:MAG: glycosyltransferase [Bacilli bacterium]
MKKLTILALHLNYGGIEKSIASLANMLCDDYEVEIIVSYKLNEEPVFTINNKVKINYLIEGRGPNQRAWENSIKKLNIFSFIKESYRGLVTLFLRRSTMVKAIRKSDADIIISTRDIFNKWLGIYGRGKALKIGWEHNHHHGDMSYANKITKSARDLDYLVLVSDSLRSYYKKTLKDYKCKCVYIPNVLEDLPASTSNLNSKKLISVGRLCREKGYEDLLDVMCLVHDIKPDWTLDIIGDGAQKNLLGDKIYNEKMNDYVRLHGYQSKKYINNLLKDTSVYLMSSVTESFGIVLLEAMSYGIPCIAFDSAEGANDLIVNNENGYLIKNRNKEDYAKVLIDLINDKDERLRLGINARKTSLKYTPDIIKKDWLKILKKRG